MQNETQVPGLAITFCIDPPSDNKDLGPPSVDPIHWTSEHYHGQQSSFQGYPPASAPQAIPRINTCNTSFEDLNSPRGTWEARSPCSSDSGWSNPSSPRIDQFGEEFRDDASDSLSDSRSYHEVSDQDAFDITAFLDLTTSDSQSPENTSFSPEYLSGPDQYQTSPTHQDTNPFPTQSLPYISPYDRVSSSSSLDYAHGYPGLASSYKEVLPVKPTHHRSTSDFLAPPSLTMTRGARSYSRGHRGHRFTISEGADPYLSTHLSPESSMFLGDDLRGRGLARAKTAPSVKSISRGRSPYERPPSQTAVGTSLVIPMFTGPISGQSTPEPECPSPGSIKDVVATDAMIQASARRRTRVANYFCSQCGNSFTTENSRKRHEYSHSGEKPYVCSFTDCGQTFSNDDDRKRHENKSKKHAQ
jgi:hypothetical protein